METTAPGKLSSIELLEVLSHSKNATAIYTEENIIIQTANDAMIAFWGKDRSVIGKPLEEAVPELKEQQFIDILKNVWLSGETFEAKDTAARLLIDGELQTFYFDFEYRAIKKETGEMYCILHTATDVTERVQTRQLVAEKELNEQKLNNELAFTSQELQVVNNELSHINYELREAYNKHHDIYDQLVEREEIFRGIFEQADLGMALLRGPDLIIEFVNDNILKIWGREKDEVIGKPHRAARPELEGQSIFDLLDNVYITGITQRNRELRVYLKSEEGLREAYVNSVYTPIKNTEGNIAGVLVIIDEVTDRVLARQQAERAQEQFRLATESANLGTWYIDCVTREMVASPRLKELFGYNQEEEMPFTGALDQILEEYRDKVIKAVDAAIEKNESYDLEYPVSGYHDGKLRWVRATGRLYDAEAGKAPFFTGTVMDITERKMDEIRKNDFIAMVSHELKTPLTSAKAYIQVLIAKTKNTEEGFMPAALNKIEQQLEKMNTLIKGFLDVSRLESGKIYLDIHPFDLNMLINEAIEETRLVSSGNEITFTTDEAISINADRDKILQVVLNFLSNAVKYSQRGKKIIVDCQKQDGVVKVSVTDQGIGISKQDIDKLFDRFYRVENKNTKTISGFGIGLYLSAEIVKRHGGQIGAVSKPEEGSTFWFTVPLD